MAHHQDRDSVGTHYSQFHSHISHKETEMVDTCKRLINSGEIDDPIDFLRNLCLSRGYSTFLQLGRRLRETTSDGENLLNLEQFTNTMNEAGFEFTNDQAEEVFNRFDRDENGNINCRDLIDAIKPEMSASRRSIVKMAFDKMDKDNAGVIPMNVLKRFYNVRSNPRYVGGIETEEEIKKTFTDHFQDENHVNAEVSREDFENYYAAVSASCDDDTYFDLLIRQFFKL